MFIIDAHCDSALQLLDAALAQSGPPHHWAPERLPPSGGLQWMACFALFENRSPYELTLELLGALDAMQEKAGLSTVCSVSELNALRAKNGSWGILRTIEGGEALGGSLSGIDEFFGRGVRAIGLTWNHPNALSGGADTPEQGLTSFGRSAIARMEELGIAVDLAHISTSGFWEAIDCVTKPPAVSHACCAALCEHRRNLSDSQIRAVAERGGVIGVCLYPVFLSENQADINTVTRHFTHLRKTGGRECVGLGSDFDGVNTLPDGITGAQDIPKLWDALKKAGMPESDIDLIAGGNWSRLLSGVLPQ